MLRIERTNGAHTTSWWTLAGLLLVPLIIALGFLGTTWHRESRLNTIKAAIVNLDQAVKVKGQTVPLGRQLAAALTENNNNPNLSWTLSDVTEAHDGLESGEYAAVVTIPAGFSKAATSVGGAAANAEQATIDVNTGNSAAVGDAAIAGQITQAATRTLNSTLTSGYLDNIYLGFNTIGEQFKKLGNGAKQLAAGATSLDSGLAQASMGATGLVSGLNQLDAAGVKLASGGSSLAGGASSLSSGAASLSSGASQLNAGMPALTSGVTQLAGGASALAAGLNTLTTSVSKSSTDTSQLAQLRTGAEQLATGAAGLNAGLGTGVTTLRAYASGSARISVPAGLAASVQAVLGPRLSRNPALVDALAALVAQAFDAGVQAGSSVGVQVLTTKDPTTRQSLSSAASALSSGASGLSSGVTALASELPKAAAKQQAQLVAGLTKLNAGAARLAAGTKTLSTNVGSLASGVSRLSSGASQLSSGASQLSSGVSSYVSGVKQYTAGVHTAATGATPLASGMSSLATGASKLSSGLATFSSQVTKGASQFPSYTAGERTTLAKVAAQPIGSPSSAIVTPLMSSTALLSVLALWLGALATFLVLRPISSRVLMSSKSSLRLVMATGVPGTIIAATQAIALGALAAVVLHLSSGRTMGLLGLLLLAAGAFVGVNHALAAWLGGVGRIISVALATLAAAAGLSGAVPRAFTVLGAFSPLTPAIRAARAIVSGGSGLTADVAQLVGWLVLAAVASTLAVVRRRQLSPAQYLRTITT